MEVQNPQYKEFVASIFQQAPFIADLGAELTDFGPGWCQSQLAITPRHLQHGGVIHAGVQATLADHTSGAAATTMLKPGQYVLTAEFKINLLWAAVGEKLVCRAQVLKAGRSLIFVEAEVFAVSAEKQTPVSKMSATMSVLENR